MTTSRYAFPCVHVDIIEYRPDSLTSLGAAIEIGGRVDWTRGQLHIVGGAVVVEHHPKCAVPIWARRERSWRSYLDEHGLHRVVRIRSTVQSVPSVPLSILSTKFNFCKTVQFLSYCHPIVRSSHNPSSVTTNPISPHLLSTHLINAAPPAVHSPAVVSSASAAAAADSVPGTCHSTPLPSHYQPRPSRCPRTAPD